MTIIEFEDSVRDLIRAQLIRTGDNPQTGDDFLPATITRYMRRSERRAYYKQIRIAPYTFQKTASLAGAGTETLALPTDFMRICKLRPNSTSSEYYREVTYDELNSNAGYVFAFLDDKIAVKSTIASGSTLHLLYWYKYTPMATSTNSNLHEITLDWAAYDCAIQCMSERGDVNIKWLIDQQQKIEDDDMPEIRRSSHLEHFMNVVPTEHLNRPDGYFVVTD